MKTVQKIQLFLLIVTLLFFVGCGNEGKSSGKTEKEIEKQNIIKNRIKSITCMEYKKYATGDMETNGSLNSFLKYDSLGNLLEKLEITDGEDYGTKDTLHIINRYKYSTKGNMIEKVDLDSIGGIDMKWIYKYDNSEKLILEKNVYRGNGKLDFQTHYKYNYKGQLIQKDELLNSGKIRTLYEYDTDGNLIKELIDPLNGEKPYTKIKYNYNRFGNLSEETEYTGSGFFSRGIFKNVSYDYDKNGNIIQEEQYGEVGLLRTTNTYDDKGNKIKVSDWNKDGSSIPDYSEYWTYTFDNMGNKITESSYNSKDELLSIYKYTYEFYK